MKSKRTTAPELRDPRSFTLPAPEISRQNTILKSINRIYEEAAHCETLEDLSQTCLNIAVEATASQYGFISEMRDDDRLHALAISNMGFEACTMASQPGQCSSLSGFPIRGLYGAVIQSCKTMLANTPFSLPESAGVPEGHPKLTAFLGVPFVRSGKASGMVAVANRDGGYSAAEQEILEALTPTILETLSRKRAELALALTARKSLILREMAQSGFWVIDLRGNLLEVNEGYCRMSGYCREELQHMRIQDLEVDETSQQISARLEWVRVQGHDLFESRHRRKDGTVVNVEIETTYMDVEGGRVAAFVHDITRRTQMQEELRKSEERYRHLVKHAPAGIYEIDFRTGRFTSVNDAMCRYVGYTREELLLMNPFDLLDATGIAMFQERARRWLSGEKPDGLVQYRVRAKDGTEHFSVLNVAFTKENGKPVGATVVGYDVTDLRQAQEALRQSEERFRLAIAHTELVVWQCDTDLRMTWVFNPYLGYAAQELLGKTAGEVMGIESAQGTTQLRLDVLSSGSGIRRTVAYRHRDGQECYFDEQVQPIQDSGGKVIGLIGLGMNVSDRVRAEQNLRKSEEGFRTMVARSLEPMLLVDESGTIQCASQIAMEDLGFEEDDVVGLSVGRFLDWTTKLDLFMRLQDFRAHIPLPARGTVRVRRKDGKWSWLDVTASVVNYGQRPERYLLKFNVIDTGVEYGK